MALGTAIKLAAEVHEFQTDKGKEPYMLHCIEVMRTVDTTGRFISTSDRDLVLSVAVLHDAIEDFEGTGAEALELQERIKQAIGFDGYTALLALTHGDGESYEDYIERVAQNWIARRVKIADLMHNMDPRRMPARDLTQKDYDRWEKYRRSLVRLEREG